MCGKERVCRGGEGESIKGSSMERETVREERERYFDRKKRDNEGGERLEERERLS